MDEQEKIAKLAYQFANLIGDKEIDKRWYDLDNRERWFDFAAVAIPLISAEALVDKRGLGGIPVIVDKNGAIAHFNHSSGKGLACYDLAEKFLNKTRGTLVFIPEKEKGETDDTG